MTGCDDIRYELGGYVLGALEPDEAANVRQHIDRCAKCASEHASLMELPGLLDLAQGIDAAAGPAARRRGAAARQRRSLAARRPLPPAPRAPAQAPPPRARARRRRACVHRGRRSRRRDRRAGRRRIRRADAELSGGAQGHAGDAAGQRARRARDRSRRHSVLLWVRGLTEDPNTVYEVRCDKGHYSISAGTFRADPEGRANLTLTTALRQGDYDRIRIVRHGWDKATRTATQTNVLTGKLS